MSDSDAPQGPLDQVISTADSVRATPPRKLARAAVLALRDRTCNTRSRTDQQTWSGELALPLAGHAHSGRTFPSGASWHRNPFTPTHPSPVQGKQLEIPDIVRRRGPVHRPGRSRRGRIHEVVRPVRHRTSRRGGPADLVGDRRRAQPCFHRRCTILRTIGWGTDADVARHGRSMGTPLCGQLRSAEPRRTLRSARRRPSGRCRGRPVNGRMLSCATIASWPNIPDVQRSA